MDCGLDEEVRSLACQPLRQVNKEEELQLPPTYRQVTYDNKKYTWTDKQQQQ